MWKVAVVMIILVVTFLVVKVAEYQKGLKEEIKKEGNIIHDQSATLIGGFSDVRGGVPHVELKLREHEVTARILSDGRIVTKTIPMELIVDAQIKSETQITKEIGLGRLMVFGVFAFGMKKNKKTTNNYLILICDDEGERRDIIFETTKMHDFVREIRRIKGIKSTF